MSKSTTWRTAWHRFYWNCSTEWKNIVNMQNGPDFMKHGVEYMPLPICLHFELFPRYICCQFCFVAYVTASEWLCAAIHFVYDNYNYSEIVTHRRLQKVVGFTLFTLNDSKRTFEVTKKQYEFVFSAVLLVLYMLYFLQKKTEPKTSKIRRQSSKIALIDKWHTTSH